jgi:hypothetical protein
LFATKGVCRLCVFVSVGGRALVFAWVWVGKLVGWWVGGLVGWCVHICVFVFIIHVFEEVFICIIFTCIREISNTPIW